MSNLDIKININKLMDYSESFGITKNKKILLKIIRSFAEYVLQFYGRLITEAIYSNRYKGKWEPVDDPEYVDYIGTTPVEDILVVMKDALEVKKIGYYFVIRFKPNYKYPGSKLLLSRVLRAIDSGTTKFHARPIFTRIIRDINKNLYALYKGYLTMKKVI